MVPVFPYQVRKAEDGWRGELLLRLKDGKSAYVVHISLEQARLLAVELRGLATDHCPHHHLALKVAQAMGGDISHIVLKALDENGGVTGVVRLITPHGMRDAQVDTAAALGLAIHMGLPVFMDGEFAVSGGNRRSAENPDAALPGPPIPPAFRDLIEQLDLPDAGGQTGDCPPADSIGA